MGEEEDQDPSGFYWCFDWFFTWFGFSGDFLFGALLKSGLMGMILLIFSRVLFGKSKFTLFTVLKCLYSIKLFMGCFARLTAGRSPETHGPRAEKPGDEATPTKNFLGSVWTLWVVRNKMTSANVQPIRQACKASTKRTRTISLMFPNESTNRSTLPS